MHNVHLGSVVSEPHYPSWRDEHGVVHMVGLHTNTSIRTECGIFIVRSGNLDLQLKHYEEAYSTPNCIACAAEWEPY